MSIGPFVTFFQKAFKYFAHFSIMLSVSFLEMYNNSLYNLNRSLLLDICIVHIIFQAMVCLLLS